MKKPTQDKWLLALNKLVSQKEATRLRETYSWAVSRLTVQGLAVDEIAAKIVEMSKQVRTLEEPKMHMSTGDLKTHLWMLRESMLKMQEALEPLEEILAEVQSFLDVGNEFYREKPLAKMLSLKSNPFHAVLGVGKLTDNKAENLTLGQLIAEIKTLKISYQEAFELVKQAEYLPPKMQMCTCGTSWIWSEDQTACPSCEK